MDNGRIISERVFTCDKGGPVEAVSEASKRLRTPANAAARP